MDTLSKERRSWNMSRIRAKHTRPELQVRSALHRLGYRFRLHKKSLPGKPDIVLPKYHYAIFVHGCFWHGHGGCKDYSLPKTNTDWWATKINTNMLKDDKNISSLKRLGWRSGVIWECELTKATKDKTIQRLIQDFSTVD